MVHPFWDTFFELIRVPFEHISLVWGIVPLYFALLLNEITSAKANFRTAIQTGFSFLWAAVQWIYPYFKSHGPDGPKVEWNAMSPINLLVTVVVLVLGVIALYSGLRRRYPKYFSFLGYSRFSNYFMITIFPIQTHYLPWTWQRFIVIVLFAVPVWLILDLGLKPLRRRG
jgi:hypothetical protein